MPELEGMCIAGGFAEVQTYIASGNAVFLADGTARNINTIAKLAALAAGKGK